MTNPGPAYGGCTARQKGSTVQLTENAAAALENLREAQGIPDGRENRLTAEQGPTGGLALRLEFVEDVSDDHEVVEKAGTEIYLDPVVVTPLENTMMDVEDTEEGLSFIFRNQES